MTATRLLQFGCWALWLGLLIVGLWPFNFFPRNHVEWLQNRNGVHFDRYGQIYSPTPWPGSLAPGSDGFSIELWLQGESGYESFSPILQMDDPSRTENFTIAQSLSDLVVGGEFRDNRGGVPRPAKLYLDRACEKNAPRFLTVVSGPQGTTLYLEGAIQRTDEGRTLTAANFSGTLLLGHVSRGNVAWTGDVLGLAIYRRALSAEEVSQHYKTWIAGKSAEFANGKDVMAHYAFDEPSGLRVRNLAGAMPDLVIPRKFRLRHRAILEFPAEFNKSDLSDAAINVLGFLPFGFCVMAYLRLATRLTRGQALVLAIILGTGTSLIIELLQVFLPSRDSSLPDLINNFIGSGLGAGLQLSIGRKRSSLPTKS